MRLCDAFWFCLTSDNEAKRSLLVNDDDKLTLLPTRMNGGMPNRDFVRNYEKVHFSMVDREKLHFSGYGISIDESTGA